MQTHSNCLVIVRRIQRKKTFLQINQLLNLNKILYFFSYYGIEFETKGTKSTFMKKLFLILLVTAGSVISKSATAQVSVSINIGSQPTWGPVGYDYVDYYYLPDIETYYYVPKHQFVYLSNGKWIFATSLPSRYGYYNLYSGYKVVINEPRPYLNFTTHRVTYAKYKGNNGRQVIIRNSNDPKYYVVKGHPKYNGGNRGNGNGHGNGNNGNVHGNGKGKGKG